MVLQEQVARYRWRPAALPALASVLNGVNRIKRQEGNGRLRQEAVRKLVIETIEATVHAAGRSAPIHNEDSLDIAMAVFDVALWQWIPG